MSFSFSNLKMLRIGLEIRTLKRERPGTNRYVNGLLLHLSNIDSSKFEFVPIFGPSIFTSRNIITKIMNAIIDVVWLNVMLPILCVIKKIKMLHMLSGEYSILLGLPQIVSIMDVNFMVFPNKWDALWSLYIRLNLKMAFALNVEHLITISEYSKINLIKYFGYSKNKIKVVYPGITKLNSKEIKKEINYPYILYVGAIEPHKNIMLLVKAFSILCVNPKYECLRLVIIGRESRGTKELKEFVGRLAIKEKVIFTGAVDDICLDKYYSGASLFAFPSLIEGFGFPSLEAMIRGIPVVASDIPCHREILGNGAIYFDPMDSNSLSNAMNSILSNDHLRNKMVIMGIDKASEYSWVKCAEETIGIYRQIALKYPQYETDFTFST